MRMYMCMCMCMDVHACACTCAQLPYLLGAIVGVRLGHGEGARHRGQTLQALGLHLSEAEVAEIDKAVAAGQILDGLART